MCLSELISNICIVKGHRMFIYTTKIIAGLLASLCGIGALYQQIKTYRDTIKYPPIGTMVDIGTHKMHVILSGNKTTEMQPTVILDAGLGGSAIDWIRVQPEIAKFARVVSYDRSGYGWSEGSSVPRTSANIVKELHNLLQEAHIDGPYILVGHSFGGINVQLYAKTYPDEVAGIVLVDSSHENEEQDMPQKMLDSFPSMSKMAWIVKSFLAPLGALRLIQQQFYMAKAKEAYAAQGYPVEMVEMNLAGKCTTQSFQTLYEEYKNLQISLNQLKQSMPCFGNTPLIVLGASKSIMSEQIKTVHDEESSTLYVQMRNRHLADMASRSTNSTLIIAEKSGHLIPLEQPEIIVETVREMLAN